MRRKVLALFSALMMIISAVCPTQVFAENDAAMTMSFSENNIDNMPVGTEFTVTVYVSKFDNLGSIGAADFRLTYDSSKVEYVESAIVKSIGMPLLNNDTDVSAVKYSFMAIPSVNLGSDALYTAKFRTIAVGKADFAASVYSLTIDGESGNSASKVKTEKSTLTIVNPCTGITLDKDTLTIARGETDTLTATVEPADTTDTIVWSSENDGIATVENGVVTAVGLGETTITATCGGKTASCKVTVTKAAITGEINVPATAEYMQTITAKYTGNAQDEGFTVTWYRDDGSIIYTGHDYPVKEDDIDHKIYVIVTSDNFTGEIKSSEITIEKATRGYAPEEPTIEANENVITITYVDSNAEYRLGSDGEFGSTTSFTVEYGKSYYVEARYPENATHKASDIVKSNSVTTPQAKRGLTVNVEGNGQVVRTPEGELREGMDVILVATADNYDNKFVRWEGVDGLGVDAEEVAITFTMGSEDVTIKAVFAEKDAVAVGFGTETTFTYNGEKQAPTYGPVEEGYMDVEVKYFVRGGNVEIEKPTNAGKYTMQVTYAPNSADSEYKTTVETCDFKIIEADQDAPDAPVLTNETSDSFAMDFVEGQEYAINTTGEVPTVWADTITTTGLEPATTYYVFTRVKGDANHNPSAAVYATVTTAHTYAWELRNGSQLETVVRIGEELPISRIAQIDNKGTGTITNIKATLGGTNADNFTLVSVPTAVNSNGMILVEVKPKGIDNMTEGTYICTVTVTADNVDPITITFTLRVAKKDVATITGIIDATYDIFDGKTKGIDLSKANVKCDNKTFAPQPNNLTVTYTQNGVTVAEPRNAGTYTATITYEDTNYIGSTTAKLIIQTRNVTLTGLTVYEKVYNGNTVAAVNYGGATLGGVADGTDVSPVIAGIDFAFEDKNVGENKTVTNTTPITLTGADAGNYNLTNPIVDLKGTITAIPATATLTVADKTYNGRTDDANVTMSVSGIIAGDDVQLVATKGVYATADAGDNVEVTVTYTISGADKGNYNFQIADKAYGKVNKANLAVVIIAPRAVAYDGKTHEASNANDNRVAADNGKTLYTMTYDGGDTLPVDAGTYSVTAKLTDEGSKNYTLVSNTVDLVINKADMTATDKEYSVAFMLAGAQTRPLSDLQLTPANISGKWSVAIKDNMENILDGASIDGENLVFTVKSGLGLGDIGGFAKLNVTFTPDKNYNPVTATVTVTLAQDTYTNSISGTLPTQVKLGDALDFSGVQLVTKFGSGAPDQTLDVTDATKVEVTTNYVATATGEAALGAKTVTFTDKANGGITYTHTFTVVDVLEGVKLEADQVGYAYKLKEATTIGFDGKVYAVYKSGAKKALTHADVVLTAVYADGTVKSIDEARLLSTLGDTMVTLTYTENYFDGTSAAQSIEIQVTVTAAPAKPDGKPTAEGFIIEPIPDEGEDMKYYDGNGNKVPAEEVQGNLANAIQEPGDELWNEVKNGGAFSNIDDDNIVYEQINFTSSKGSVDYKNGKMQITVPYPADSDKNDEFVMVIQDKFGHTETIVPIKTADGLQFITDLSNFKFAIGWYTPAPTPVQPSEPAEDPQDSFWNEVYWALIRSGSGSVITANAGYYDKVPQGVLRAVDASGNTLIINSAFGVQVVVTPGALEKLGAYRFYYPISYLKEMLKGSTVISGSGSTGVTIGVLMPTTGDATVVDHPYSMTPATAGIIPGLESVANARPVIDNADGVSVLDGAQRNEGAVIGGGMLIGLGLLALLGAAYVTMRKRGN